MNDVYSRLREFMHTFPERYPLSGVEMKILNKLFSLEDAELYLSMMKKEPEALTDISRRLGREEGEREDKLENMGKRGLIFPNREDDKLLWRGIGWGLRGQP